MKREASVITKKGHKTLGIWRTGVEEKICLSSLKALCWRFQGLFFWIRRFREATILERFGMNLQ